MKRLVIFFILSFLLLAGNTAGVVAQDNNPESETYIIVYDESHFQYFTADMMSIALSTLNTSLDTDEVDVTVELVIQKEKFNSTNIQGVDLVMITNPGLDNGTLPEIDDDEVTALESLIDIGGNVFWLSNPLSYDTNITGHANPLNQLLFSGFGGNVRTTTGDNDNVTVILDDFNYVNNNSYIKLDSDNFNEQVMTNELNNISKANDASFLYYGAQVQENNNLEGQYYANTSQTAYSINKNFEIANFQDSPRWMYGRDFSSGSRGLLVGSTIMFSDVSFDGTDAWVNQFNNLELFQNLISWVLGITPLPDAPPIVDEPFSPFFVQNNILWAFGLGLVFFVGFVLILIRQNRLQVSKIFDIFIKSSGSSSSDNKSGSTFDSSKSKKASKKSKRRKRV